MLILLEGPDGAGKSTLAKRLEVYLKAKYKDDRVELLHRGPPKEHPLVEYAEPLHTYRPGTGHHMIMDRWHWGELVYPKFLGRKSKMTGPVFSYIEDYVAQLGGVTCHVTVPLSVLTARVTRRGDDLIKIEQLDAITKRFHQVCRRSITGWQPPSYLVEPIVDRAYYHESGAR